MDESVITDPPTRPQVFTTPEHWNLRIFEFGGNTIIGGDCFHGKNAKVIQPGIGLVHYDESISNLWTWIQLEGTTVLLKVLVLFKDMDLLILDLKLSPDPYLILILLLVDNSLMLHKPMMHILVHFHLIYLTLTLQSLILTVATGVKSLRRIILLCFGHP